MKQDEFSPLPDEFRESPDEIKKPGEEYAEKAPQFPEEPRAKKRLFVLAAAVLFLGFLAFPQIKSAISPTPSTGPAESTETDTAPTETESTETVTKVQCHPVFFAFSDSLRAKLTFDNPDKISAVRAEVWDSLGGNLEQSFDVPADAVKSGEYTLPDLMGMFEMYMAHHSDYDPSDDFPVPELRVFMMYEEDGQEKTEEIRQVFTEEQGWGARIREGQIVFRTYESFEPLMVSVGTENAETEANALASGEILVVISVDGKPVPKDQCTVTNDEETWQDSEGKDVKLYYAGVSTPEQSGKITVSVYQKLKGYDVIWSENVELK